MSKPGPNADIAPDHALGVKCRAHSARTKEPCKKWAIKGAFVCRTHGGAAPQVKRKARRRLLAMVEPTLDTLVDLRDQRVHLPTTLGAAKEILKRALDEEKVEGPKGPTGPVINIGVAIGGANPQQVRIGVQAGPPAVNVEPPDEGS